MVLTATPPRVCTRSASESIPLNTDPWQARSLEPLTSGAVRGQAWVWDTNVGDWRATRAPPAGSRCVPLSDARARRSWAAAALPADCVPTVPALLAGEELGARGGEPVLLVVAEHELQQLCQVVQVLAGVVPAGYRGGLREVLAGQVPDLIPVPRLSRQSSLLARCRAVSAMRAGIVRGRRASR